MAQLQYIRKIKLIVSTESGEGLDLSNLRIVFDIKQGDSQTPNASKIRVYNLSQDTIARIKREFTIVTLQAGYESNFGTIFEGNIKEVIYGSDNTTDNFIDIACGDADFAYNNAVINKTLNAGANQSDIVGAALFEMTQMGVKQGFIDDLSSPKLPRGKVMYGMSRDFLRNSAYNTQSSYSIQNGTYQMIKLTGVLPTEAVVLSSKTGLIDRPQQTNDGIVAKCLLNPNIKIGSSININQADVQEEIVDGTDDGNAVNNPSPIAADGFYRVYVIEFTGDTRGNDWFSIVTGLSMDITQPEDNQVKLNG